MDDEYETNSGEVGIKTKDSLELVLLVLSMRSCPRGSSVPSMNLDVMGSKIPTGSEDTVRKLQIGSRR